MNRIRFTDPALTSYIGVTALGITLGGLAAGCAAFIASLPPSPWAWVGFGAGACGVTVLFAAVLRVPIERGEYWRWRRENQQMLKALTEQPEQVEQDQPDGRELIYTPKGPALMDRRNNVMTMLKGWRKGRAPAAVAAFAQMTEVIGRIDVTSRENPNSVDRLDFSEGMYRLARYGAANKPTAESEWTGRDKPFSLDEYRALRDWMMTKGHAQWKGKGNTQGWEYTRAGLASLRWLSRQPTPPERTNGVGL